MHSPRPTDAILQPALTRREFVHDLAPETLQELERIRTRYVVQAGEALFTRAEPASRLLEIASGAAKLWLDRPRQEPLLIRLARAGEILALREVVVGCGYGVNATAATAMEVYGYPRRPFLNLLHRHFDAGFTATRVLSAELNSAHENLRTLLAGTAGSSPRDRRHRAVLV